MQQLVDAVPWKSQAERLAASQMYSAPVKRWRCALVAYAAAQNEVSVRPRWLAGRYSWPYCLLRLCNHIPVPPLNVRPAVPACRSGCRLAAPAILCRRLRWRASARQADFQLHAGHSYIGQPLLTPSCQPSIGSHTLCSISLWSSPHCWPVGVCAVSRF